MGGACGTYGDRKGAYKVLVGEPEGMSLLGIPRRRWEDNIKAVLRELWCGALGLI
jgi:hypothetical protein